METYRPLFVLIWKGDESVLYDVIIIGAGVTGSAVARELSRYKLNVCVLDKEEDVCCGTSKANSAIVHSGYDAPNGSLKAKFNVRGNRMMEAVCRELDVPFKRIGSLTVCTEAELLPELDKLREEVKPWAIQDEDVLSYALFEQVAVKFFEKRKAKMYGLDTETADFANKVHNV